MRKELQDWAAQIAGPRTQHPIDELIAEHDLIRIVLDAVKKEALRRGEPRMEFWNAAADFIGNFGLLNHWRKKSTHLYPTLQVFGHGEAILALEDMQSRDIDLALELSSAAQDGDGKKLAQIAILLASTKLEMMMIEERDILIPGKSLLSEASVSLLRGGFDMVEINTLPGRTRRDFLEIARTLARLAGIDDPIG